jgi:hypothetical protein
MLRPAKPVANVCQYLSNHFRQPHSRARKQQAVLPLCRLRDWEKRAFRKRHPEQGMGRLFALGHF